MGQLEDELRYILRFAMTEENEGRQLFETGQSPVGTDALRFTLTAIPALIEMVFRLAREIDEMRGT